MQSIAKAYRTMRHWVWPSLCRLCDQWGYGAICKGCLDQHWRHVKRCDRCAMPSVSDLCSVYQSQPPIWQHCQAALPYTEPWRALIADFKFNQTLGLVDFWGECLRLQASQQGLLANADWVLPVPLSRERLRARGFNQSLVLAQSLNHPALLPDGLLRLRHTEAQAGLSRQERLLNLTHAFACNPRHVLALQHRRVLLIDDVMTTGSTLQACTQALLDAGVQQVDLLVLARAEGRQGSQSGPAH